MIVERSMSENWLSNTYLLADKPGGQGVLIDSGGPADPILSRIEKEKLEITHLLCTHHHYDHVAHNEIYKKELSLSVCAHRDERNLFKFIDLEIEHHAKLEVGTLTIEAVHIPGHTLGQLAFIVNGSMVFTGDTLFKGSVGGTRAPGHGTFQQLQRSIMDVLMKLPHEMVVYPGHTKETTIGDEWNENPFIRAWRGVDPVVEKPCQAYGEEATLILRAEDYDGGTKCWVRFSNGQEDIVPGSKVS